MKPAENLDLSLKPFLGGKTPCDPQGKSASGGIPVCKPVRSPASRCRLVRRSQGSRAVVEQCDLFGQLPVPSDRDVTANVEHKSNDPQGQPTTGQRDAIVGPVIADIAVRRQTLPIAPLREATKPGTFKRGSIRLHLDDKATVDVPAAAHDAHQSKALYDCIDELDRRGELSIPERERFAEAITRVSRIAKVDERALPADPVALRPLLAQTLPTATRSPAKPLARARAALRDLLGRAGWVDRASLRTAPTHGVWARLLAEAGGLASIKGLPQFARFCAARGVTPDAVTAEAFVDFEAFLFRRTLEIHPRVAVVAVSNRWNYLVDTVPFWPRIVVTLPSQKLCRSGPPLMAKSGLLTGSTLVRIGSAGLQLTPDAQEASFSQPASLTTPPSGSERPQTLAACLGWVAKHEVLPPSTMRRAESAVTTIARVLRRASADLPADPCALRPLLATVLPVADSITAKRWANVAADLKGLLTSTGWVSPLARRTAPLVGPWALLVASAAAHAPVRAIPPFARWCAAEGVLPEDVRSEHVERFEVFRSDATLDRNPRATVIQLTRAWHRLARLTPGWPRAKLALSPRQVRRSLREEELPASFAEDLGRYMTALANPDPFDTDASRPLAPRTIKEARYAMLRAAAILHAQGTPRDSLHRLSDLARVDRVKAVLLALHSEAGGRWTSQTLHTANALLVMARRWAKVPPETLEGIKALRRAIRPSRDGLSSRAQEMLAQLSDDRTRRELFALSGRAFEQAEKLLREGRASAAPVGTDRAFFRWFVTPSRAGSTSSL